MPRSPTFQFTAHLLHVLTWAWDLPAFPAPEGSSCGGPGPAAALGGLGAESSADGPASGPLATLPPLTLSLTARCSTAPSGTMHPMCCYVFLCLLIAVFLLPKARKFCQSTAAACLVLWHHPGQDGTQTRMTPSTAARCRLPSRVSGGNGPSCSTSHPILTDTGLLPKAGS